MQAQRQLEATAQKAIEDRITNLTFFEDAIADTGVWSDGIPSVQFTANAYVITVYRPRCTYSMPDEGTSALNPLVPEGTAWDVRATASDPVTGGSVDVSQGVRMRMLADNCPP